MWSKWFTCVAITTVNWEKNEGFVSIKVTGCSSMNLALTASLSSWRKAHTHFAFGCPRFDSLTEDMTKSRFKFC